jgi:hypothetical protein
LKAEPSEANDFPAHQEAALLFAQESREEAIELDDTCVESVVTEWVDKRSETAGF